MDVCPECGAQDVPNVLRRLDTWQVRLVCSWCQARTDWWPTPGQAEEAWAAGNVTPDPAAQMERSHAQPLFNVDEFATQRRLI